MREFLRQKNVYDEYCIVSVSHDIIDIQKNFVKMFIELLLSVDV